MNNQTVSNNKQVMILAFSFGLICLILTLFNRSEKAPLAEGAEQTLRQKIRNITLYESGQIATGETVLNLTIEHRLLGLFSPDHEIYCNASQVFRTAYPLLPDTDSIEIQYDLEYSNPYGAISHQPHLRIELSRRDYARIQWQTFKSKNLPKIANVTPLANL